MVELAGRATWLGAVVGMTEAGADVLCVDSSDGFSEWQADAIQWIRKSYGDRVKVGGGNIVDAEGFRFLGVIFLKDLLLQPFKPGRKHLRVLSAAGPLPPAFFPESERRPLRRYRSF